MAVLATTLAVVVVAALVLALVTGNRAGERSIASGGPSVTPPSAATLDGLVQRIQATTSVPVTSAPLEQTSHTDAQQLGAGVPGYVSGTAIDQADGNLTVVIETFDSPAAAQAFNEASVRSSMDEHRQIHRFDAPVVGATAYTCECGNAFVSFTRGAVRVHIYVPSSDPDPKGRASRVSAIVDQTLRADTPTT